MTRRSRAVRRLTGDFEDIRLPTFGQIKDAFEAAGKFPVGFEKVTIEVQS